MAAGRARRFRTTVNYYLELRLRELTLAAYLGLVVCIVRLGLLADRPGDGRSAPPILTTLACLLFLALAEVRSSRASASSGLDQIQRKKLMRWRGPDWLAGAAWIAFLCFDDYDYWQRWHTFRGSVLEHVILFPHQSLVSMARLVALCAIYAMEAISFGRLRRERLSLISIKGGADQGRARKT